MPCPLNCQSCNGPSCDTCNPGFTFDSGVCVCGTNCQSCLNNTNNSCSECITGSLNCSGCAAGYYLSATSCLPCLSICQSCTNNISCSSCIPPFILDFSSQCICNETNGMYLMLNETSCASCGVAIPNCVSCQVGSPTFCL